MVLNPTRFLNINQNKGGAFMRQRTKVALGIVFCLLIFSTLIIPEALSDKFYDAKRIRIAAKNRSSLKTKECRISYSFFNTLSAVFLDVLLLFPKR